MSTSLFMVIDFLILNFLAVFQGPSARGSLFAATQAIMLCDDRPLGDWVPSDDPLWSLDSLHRVLAAPLVQPRATQTAATSHSEHHPKRRKWHGICFPPWGLQFDPRSMEVWLLPWKRGGCDQRVVWGEELLLHPCFLSVILYHPSIGEKRYPLVFLYFRFSFVLTRLNKRHISRTKSNACEKGEDLLPSWHPHSRVGCSIWDKHTTTCQGECNIQFTYLLLFKHWWAAYFTISEQKFIFH